MNIFGMWETIKFLKRKKNKFIAVTLDELENILPKEEYPQEYELVRKLILDMFNDYHRSVYKIVLGIDVEGQEYL
jgi:hypothetical protein